MNEEFRNHSIDPELEARIVALVLGEASDYERDQLNRIIDRRPELASLKEQFESVNGLLQDIGTGELPAKVDDWKLPAEKRSAVLAVIRGEAKEPAIKALVNVPAIARAPLTDISLWSFAKVAAVVCVVGLFGTLTIGQFSFQMAREASSRGRAFDVASESELGAASAPSSQTFSANSERSAGDVDRLYQSAQSTSEGLLEYGKESKSALEEIRGSLGTNAPMSSPDYVKDDVWDLPVSPQSQLSEGAAASPLSGADKPTEAWGKALGLGNAQREKFGAIELGQEQESSRGLPPLRAGTVLDFSVIPDDSPTAGKGILGYDMAGGFGGGNEKRNAQDPFADLRSEPSKASQPEVAEGEPSVEIGFGGITGLPKDDADIRFQNGSFGLAPPTGAVDRTLKNRISLGGAVNSDAGLGFERGTEDRSVDAIPFWETQSSQLKREQVDLGRQIANSAIDTKTSRGLSSRSSKEKPAAPAVLNENDAEQEAFSTFSLHVSDVSFKLAQGALARGEWPESAKVRIEEFVNAFDYGDPMPNESEKVACRVEQSIHPFLQQRNLMRVSMRTAAAGRSSDTSLRLTFLLDNSGSMERIDRQQSVRRAFALLAQQLTPIDQVTLISFARQPRLLADKVSGAQSQQLVQLIDDLPSEGGTNIEAALRLAFEKAREQQADNAQNRIVLLTDGAVNLGDANPDSLSQMIATIREAGIAFDAAGISAEGLNDEILEALTRKGDGRYYLLDSIEDADDGFVRQIAGALRPSAKNVKVQIEFNSKRVGRYKLLGFEKHLLEQEDFRNDQVDAAEMAAAEAGVAVYQFEAKPDGEGDVGSVSVRFRDLSTGEMIENRWPIPYEADAPRIDQAAPSLRIACSAALFAAKLRGEPLGETVNLKTLSDLILGLPQQDFSTHRIQQLQRMIAQARELNGN